MVFRHKENIIDNLDLQLYDIFGDTSFYTIIPTCQEITVRSIKLAFNKNKYWLYISLENCGNCKYCKTYNSSYFYSTLCIPLIEAESIDKNDISLSEDQIRVINSRFSNIFKAY